MTGKLYKVLVDGQSAHGGMFTWSLPEPDGDGGWIPGEWSPRIDDVKICKVGYHLTYTPEQWLTYGCGAYEAGTDSVSDWEGDKIVCHSARLLRPAPEMIPSYWRDAERFILDLQETPWASPDGNPDPAWTVTNGLFWSEFGGIRPMAMARVFAERAERAGRKIAYDRVLMDVRDIVTASHIYTDRFPWGVGISAQLDAKAMATVLIVRDLGIDQATVNRIEQRWNVWAKGYILLGEIDGVLHVYAPGTEDAR